MTYTNFIRILISFFPKDTRPNFAHVHKNDHVYATVRPQRRVIKIGRRQREQHDGRAESTQK